jgi:hypothetical protein
MSGPYDASTIGRLTEAAVTALWAQWRALGVRVTETPTPARCVIDPEALILASAALLDHEPRLRDVLGAWFTERPQVLSTQRIGNLCRSFPALATSRVPALARVAVVRGKDFRWRKLAAGAGSDLPLGDRGKELVSEVRRPPSSTLLIQLRRGMGVGVKADVLGYLLAVATDHTQWVPVSAIREALDYSTVAISRAAEEMRAGHFVIGPSPVDRHTRMPRAYRAERQAWGRVLELDNEFFRWTAWAQHFLFVTRLVEWQRETAGREVTEYAYAVKLREWFEGSPRALEIGRTREEPIPTETAALPAFFERRVTSWMDWVRNEG